MFLISRRLLLNNLLTPCEHFDHLDIRLSITYLYGNDISNIFYWADSQFYRLYPARQYQPNADADNH